MSFKDSEYSKQASYKSKKSIEKAEIKPLDSDQVFKIFFYILQVYRAQEILLEQHPLSQIKLYKAIPELQWLFRCKCKKEQLPTKSRENSVQLLDQLPDLEKKDTETSAGKSTNKKSARKSYLNYIKNKLRLGVETTKNSKDFDDPFINYGYGVVAFFNLLKTLIAVFSILTLLNIPIIIAYHSQGSAISKFYGSVSTTLGNLGSSYSNCFQAPLAFNGIYLNCNNGFHIAEISSIGIQVSIHAQGYREDRYCNFPPNYDDYCQSTYSQNLKDTFDQQCVGNQICNIQNIKSLLNNNENTNPSCLNDSSFFFAQFKCYKSEAEMKNHRILGLVVACIGIFACFLFIFVIDFEYRTNELNSIIWDLQTVTVNDYTVDLNLNQKIMTEYEKYSETTPINNETLSNHLSKFLKTYIETSLKEYGQKTQLDEYIVNNKLEIAMIEYDFDQRELLRMLIQRGEHIKNLKFENKRKLESQINRYTITNKNKLENPIRCFITFEHTEGHNEFISMIEEQKCLQHHQNIEAKTAPEPTDIIWEDRNQTHKEIIKKRFFAFIFIGILLMIAMVGAFIVRQHGSKASSLYKPQNCRQIWNQYGNNLDIYAQQAFSQSENFFNDLLDIEDVDRLNLDLITCYCIQEFSDYTFQPLRDRFNISISHQKNLSEENYEMCTTVKINYLAAKFIDFAGGESIVGVNYVLRVLIIFLVKFIGYDTQTKQTSTVLKAVLVVQFINTNLIIIFMNADLTQIGIPMINIFSQGYYPDFTFDWYKQIGSLLISTMIFNIYWPILEFFAFFGLRMLYRILDRGLCECSEWQTKRVTIQQYVELYSGPEYMIHYKYSSIINIVYITFMFGVGIPILFPIALASFVTLYIMERLLVAYSYQRPPMFNKDLNKQTLRLLMFAPLFYCSVGFWMLNNLQTFYNSVGLKQYFDDNIQTQHTLRSAFRLDHSTPLLIFFFVFLILRLFRGQGKKLFKKFIVDPSMFKFKTDQVSFFESLNEYQRKWLITEERKSREKFEIQKLSDETLLKLETAPYSKDTELIGVMTYQILDNPYYQKHFQYVPEIFENRDKFIVDDYVLNQLGQSDYVKKNISKFYLPQSEQ